MWRIYQTIFTLIFCATATFLSGCDATMSPVKETSVHIEPVEIPMTVNPQKVLVQFESTLSGVPLVDTVWDNKMGPFADPQGSDSIGFIQDEDSIEAAGIIGGTGAAVAVGISPSYTTILIPFGRVFEGVFQTGLPKDFPNSTVIFGDSPLSAKLENGTGYIVQLRVVEFKVWEHPLNHLNLTATIECKVYQANDTKSPVHVYEAHNELLKQSVGSVLSTDISMARNMNKIANQFAATLSLNILNDLRDNIGK